MLTDTALRNLRPKDKAYKVADRDGMYVHVATSGTVTFRYDYRLHGRRETLTIGKYGPAGISLARAREKCIDARRAVSDGQSPAREKQREKRRLKEAKSFGQFGERWFSEAPMADSTRAMRRTIYERDMLPVLRNRLLTEITPDDLRALCGKVKARGAARTPMHWCEARYTPEPALHAKAENRRARSQLTACCQSDISRAGASRGRIGLKMLPGQGASGTGGHAPSGLRASDGRCELMAR